MTASPVSFHASKACEPDQNCSICWAPLAGTEFVVHDGEGGSLHPFHKTCIHTWVTINANCPNCRRTVNAASILSETEMMNRRANPAPNRRFTTLGRRTFLKLLLIRSQDLNGVQYSLERLSRLELLTMEKMLKMPPLIALWGEQSQFLEMIRFASHYGYFSKINITSFCHYVDINFPLINGIRIAIYVITCILPSFFVSIINLSIDLINFVHKHIFERSEIATITFNQLFEREI